MNYTKVPRELIYKERTDINDFDVHNAMTPEHVFLMKLLERPFMNSRSAPDYALKIFNNAHYICTLILMEKSDLPLLYMPVYRDMAADGRTGDLVWCNHVKPATMALVYNLLIHHKNFFPDHPVMKKIWDSFQDWDINGSPQGKADFYELIIDASHIASLPPFDPLAPRFIVEALISTDAIFIVNGIDYVIEAIEKIDDWPEDGIYTKKCLQLVLAKMHEFEYYDSDRPLSPIIEKLQSLQKKYGGYDEVTPAVQSPNETPATSSEEYEHLQTIVDEQKEQIEQLQAENAHIPQLRHKVTELEKQLSEKQSDEEMIEIPRQRIRIEILNFLFAKLNCDIKWMTKNRKQSALARVYAAIMGHNNPKALIKDVGKVVYDERPPELNGEIDKVNRLLQDINIDWKIIL